MTTILDILCILFNIILFPFVHLPSFYGFLFISILTGFIAVLVFKYTSNQTQLKTIIRQIKLHLIEIYLYKDNLSQIVAAQKQIIKNNFIYLKYSIIGAIPVMCTVLIILSQINIRYSLQPLNSQDSFIVKVKLSSKVNFDEVKINFPNQFELITPGFHIPEKNEIEWQLKALEQGVYDIGIESGSELYNKKVLIGKMQTPYSPHLGRNGFIEQILNPIEQLLPNHSFLETIDIKYKTRKFELIVEIHWVIAFLIIAIASGFLFRMVLKVG